MLVTGVLMFACKEPVIHVFFYFSITKLTFNLSPEHYVRLITGGTFFIDWLNKPNVLREKTKNMPGDVYPIETAQGIIQSVCYTTYTINYIIFETNNVHHLRSTYTLECKTKCNLTLR